MYGLTYIYVYIYAHVYTPRYTIQIGAAPKSGDIHIERFLAGKVDSCVKVRTCTYFFANKNTLNVNTHIINSWVDSQHNYRSMYTLQVIHKASSGRATLKCPVAARGQQAGQRVVLHHHRRSDAT